MASVKNFKPGLDPFECFLCNKKMTSLTSFDNHLAGKFHRAKESANNRLVDANRHNFLTITTDKTLTTDTNIVTTTSRGGKMPNSRQQVPMTLPTVSHSNSTTRPSDNPNVGATADASSPFYSFPLSNCKMPNSRQPDSSHLTKMPNCRQQGPIFIKNPTLPTVLHSNSISKSSTLTTIDPRVSALAIAVSSLTPTPTAEPASAISPVVSSLPDRPCKDDLFDPALDTSMVSNPNSISKSSAFTVIDPRDSSLAFAVSSLTPTPASGTSATDTSTFNTECAHAVDVFSPLFYVSSDSDSSHLIMMPNCRQQGPTLLNNPMLPTVLNSNSIPKSSTLTVIDPRGSSLAIAISSLTGTPAAEPTSASSAPSTHPSSGLYDDICQDPMKMVMKGWTDESRQRRRHAQKSRLSPRFSGCFNQSALFGDCIGSPVYLPTSPFLCRFCDIVFDSAHTLETHLGSIEHVHQFRDIHDRFFIASYTKLLFSRINSDDIHDKMFQLAKKTVDFDVFNPDPELLNIIHLEPPMHPIPGILDFGSDEEDSYSHGRASGSDHDDCELDDSADMYEDEYGLPYGY